MALGKISGLHGNPRSACRTFYLLETESSSVCVVSGVNMPRRRQIHFHRGVGVFGLVWGFIFPPALNSVSLLIVANQAHGRGRWKWHCLVGTWMGRVPLGEISAVGGKSLFFPSCRAGKPQLWGIFGTPLQLVVLGGSLLTLP